MSFWPYIPEKKKKLKRQEMFSHASAEKEVWGKYRHQLYRPCDFQIICLMTVVICSLAYKNW